MSEVDRGLAGDPADLMLADGEGACVQGPSKVRAIGQVDGAAERKSTAEEIPVRRYRSKVGIHPVLFQKIREQGAARAGVSRAHFGETCQSSEELTGSLDQSLVIGCGDGGQVQCLLLRLGGGLPPLFPSGVENQPRRRKDGEEDEQQEAAAKAREGKSPHKLHLTREAYPHQRFGNPWGKAWESDEKSSSPDSPPTMQPQRTMQETRKAIPAQPSPRSPRLAELAWRRGVGSHLRDDPGEQGRFGSSRLMGDPGEFAGSTTRGVRHRRSDAAVASLRLRRRPGRPRQALPGQDAGIPDSRVGPNGGSDGRARAREANAPGGVNGSRELLPTRNSRLSRTCRINSAWWRLTGFGR